MHRKPRACNQLAQVARSVVGDRESVHAKRYAAVIKQCGERATAVVAEGDGTTECALDVRPLWGERVVVNVQKKAFVVGGGGGGRNRNGGGGRRFASKQRIDCLRGVAAAEHSLSEQPNLGQPS